MEIDSVYLDTSDVVVRFDPEWADMGNPSGAVYSQRILVCATTPNGRRFNHIRTFDTTDVERAERLAARIKNAGRIDLEHWNETYEIYGSDAWCAADRERELAHQSNPHTAGTVRDY
jgi:hypothetical protein